MNSLTSDTASPSNIDQPTGHNSAHQEIILTENANMASEKESSLSQTYEFLPKKGSENYFSKSQHENFGQRFITEDFSIHMLQWNPSWIRIQRHSKELAPICSEYPVVKNTYENELEYYSTYIKLHLLNIWIEMCQIQGKTLAYEVHFERKDFQKNCIKISCSTILGGTDCCPREDDIILCKIKKVDGSSEEIFGRVASVQKENHKLRKGHTGMCKIKFDFYCIESLTIPINNKMKVQVIFNIGLAVLQSEALRSLSDKIKFIVLDPNSHAQSIDIFSYLHNESVAKTKEVRRKIIASLSCVKTRVALVTTSIECDTVDLLMTLAYSIMKRDFLVIVCFKKEESFLRLTRLFMTEFSPGPVLAVKAEDLQSKNDKRIVKCILEKRMENKENVADIVKSCPIILTLFSSFSFGDCKNELLKWNTICIIDEAHLCTEMETALPLMYNIEKMVLLGNPLSDANVPMYLKNFRYNVSLFQRLYQAK